METMTTKTFSIRKTQKAFLMAARDVCWSKVVRTALDQKIMELVREDELKGK